MTDSLTLTLNDETFSGDITNRIDVRFSSEEVTVRDIIEQRVRNEVDAFNSKQPDFFNGLVQPNDAERTLNGYKLRSKHLVDPEQQVYTALAAFQKNGYFVLIDNVQAESLDQEFRLTSSTRISFVKLTQLVGG
ncbi:MAG TPA: hypothetical protein VEY71_10245 [Chitinophagales bacterium]|nr:hypothetical protein [Chitinophagales bacterium]